MVHDFLSRLSGKNIFIYGAGYDATLVHHILELNNLKVTSFIVDVGFLRNESYRNIPIIEYNNDTKKKLQNSVLLVAMNSTRNKSDKIIALKDSLQSEVFDCNKDLLNKLLLFNCENLLIKYGIDVTKEFLVFKTFQGNEVSILNPYLINQDILSAFALELPDLIIPEIDPDFLFMNEGKYETDNVLVSKGDIVFDCGANIGIFSSIAASKGAVVYAFEPASTILPFLNKIAVINKNIIPVPIALSNKIGTISFSESSENSTSHSIVNEEMQTNSSYHNSESSKIVKVPVDTIDNFTKKNNLSSVDFIKADIEGAERFLLSGAKEVMREFAPKLSICTYHLPDDKEVLEDIVKTANPKYTVKHFWKKMYAYVEK